MMTKILTAYFAKRFCVNERLFKFYRYLIAYRQIS
jgi:hypothetical protein